GHVLNERVSHCVSLLKLFLSSLHFLEAGTYPLLGLLEPANRIRRESIKMGESFETLLSVNEVYPVFPGFLQLARFTTCGQQPALLRAHRCRCCVDVVSSRGEAAILRRMATHIVELSVDLLQLCHQVTDDLCSPSAPEDRLSLRLQRLQCLRELCGA